MTEQFKEYVDRLSKGLNFPNNALVLSFGEDDGENLNMTTTFNGNDPRVGMLVEHILIEYIKALKENLGNDCAKAYADMIKAHLDEELRGSDYIENNGTVQ